MIYLSDEEQEIFDEGFKAANYPYFILPEYQFGTLGYDLWWKGFNANTMKRVKS